MRCKGECEGREKGEMRCKDECEGEGRGEEEM